MINFKEFIFIIFYFICINYQINTNSKNNEIIRYQQSSEHFEFYSIKKDIESLKDLEINLEKNYFKITNDLGTSFSIKIKVYIYPDIKTFHEKINIRNGPGWLVGIGLYNELHMVSPLNPGSIHSYESLIKVVVHEFTHVATINLIGNNRSIPKWLYEGIGYYEAEQITDTLRKKIKDLVLKDEIPTFNELETMSYIKFGDTGGYNFSAIIVEFLIENYGLDKVISLIKQPENYKSIFGLSKEELEKKWIKYVKSN